MIFMYLMIGVMLTTVIIFYEYVTSNSNAVDGYRAVLMMMVCVLLWPWVIPIYIFDNWLD